MYIYVYICTYMYIYVYTYGFKHTDTHPFNQGTGESRKVFLCSALKYRMPATRTWSKRLRMKHSVAETWWNMKGTRRDLGDPNGMFGCLGPCFQHGNHGKRRENNRSTAVSGKCEAFRWQLWPGRLFRHPQDSRPYDLPPAHFTPNLLRIAQFGSEFHNNIHSHVGVSINGGSPSHD